MAIIKNILIVGGAALAVATFSAPAQACNHGCPTTTSSSTGSTGGTDVPAPAALGLFAASAIGLIARRRRARG